MPRAGPRHSTRNASSRSSVSRLRRTSTLSRRSLIDEHFPKIPPGGEEGPASSFRVHYEEHSAAMHLHATDVMRRVADFVPKDSYQWTSSRPNVRSSSWSPEVPR